MPPRSPRKEERDGTTGRKYPMSITDKIRRKIVGYDPHPEPANPRGPLVPVEDFAAEARAEVSTPKRVQR